MILQELWPSALQVHMSLQTNVSNSIDDLDDIIVSKETTFSHNLLENALDIHAPLVVKKVNQIKKT